MDPDPATSPPRLRADQDPATVAAHDLREPLETLAGLLGVLERRHAGALEPEGQELLHHAVESSRRMRAVLDDLLRAARTGGGPPREQVDLALVAAEVVDALGAQIGRTAGRVDLEALPRVPGDRVALRRALQNLVSNALDAAEGAPPHVELRARRAPAPDGSGREGWAVEVRDHGPGVPEADRERVFAPYARVEEDGGETPTRPGAGLGLALTRSIALAHGGTVGVGDAPGGGALFTLWLPG